MNVLLIIQQDTGIVDTLFIFSVVFSYHNYFGIEEGRSREVIIKRRLADKCHRH